MTMSESKVSGFAERLRAALPEALAEAFGGTFEGTQVNDGPLEMLIQALGPGQHVLLELEVSGRTGRNPLLLVLQAGAAATVFGLDPIADGPLPPEAQLRILAELTEGGETLLRALGPRLSAAATGTTVGITGASLEEADASTATAATLVGGDAVSVLLEIPAAGGETINVVACCAPEIGALLGGEEVAAATGDSAADRAAKLAARQRAAEPVAAALAQPVPAAQPGRPAAAAPSGAAPVLAHPFTFGQLDAGPSSGGGSRNIEPLLDVVLQVRVELGSTEMTVEEVLALTIGSVVELDRLAGEPVDVVVNNRLLARGEVVVVEENFGVRLTEIVSSRGQRAS
jgi:flagellar motor switch protein FliN/FliY